MPFFASLNRHTFRAMLACWPSLICVFLLDGCATGARGHMPPREMLYASVGPELTWYDMDASNAQLTRRGSVKLPANVQNAWPSASRRWLYAAWSDGGPGITGTRHGVSAFAIDGTSGALTRIGTDAPLPSRPIHLIGNSAGTYMFVAHNVPSGVTVLALRENGEIERVVTQSPSVEVGNFAHQVRVDASDNSIFVVTRGVPATSTMPEQPGAVKQFHVRDGALSLVKTTAPAGGFGFQARNLDFHPAKPWVYLALEQQNALQMFELAGDGSLASEPRFTASTLDTPVAEGVSQTVGAIVMHPSGRHVYVINRAGGTRAFKGSRVSAGGLNTIAVFAIDDASGKPTRIANTPTRGFSVRTFGLDAAGRWLAVGNQSAMSVAEGDSVRVTPASIALFRIGSDGLPAFERKFDVETNAEKNLLWVGFVPMP
ncbi:MAG: beta-propeller fold lactonase family protein [bacterium]